MTEAMLEGKIEPFKVRVTPELGRLLALAPPQPIHDRKTYRAYDKILGLCLEALALGGLRKPYLQALKKYIEIISPLLADYEKREFPASKTTQGEVLKFLMDQHDLTQADLGAVLGGQPAVSYVLNGRRQLNARQIERLSKRFTVSPAVFFPAA